MRLKRVLKKPWMKPLRAAGHLSLGRGVRGLLSLVYLALAARALGVEAFGVLALIHSLVLTAAILARFQSWQAVVHYCTKALEKGEPTVAQSVIRFTLLLDIAGVVIAYLLVVLTAQHALAFFGLSPELRHTVQVYGLVVLFIHNQGMAHGVLQQFDRFAQVARQTAVPALVRTLGSAVLLYTGGGISEFLVLWFIAELLGSVVLFSYAWAALKTNSLVPGLGQFSRADLAPVPGAWRYVWGTQLASTLDLSNTQLPVLMTGVVLGPIGAGVFRIAKQFASVLARPPSQIFARAIYPDLARYSARRDMAAATHTMKRTALVVGALGLLVFAVILLAGRPMIVLTAGPDFAPAYAAMVWLSAAGLLGAITFALDPMLVASGAVREAVKARIVATLVYIPALYLLLERFGVTGTGMAAILAVLVNSVLMFYAVRRLLIHHSA